MELGLLLRNSGPAATAELIVDCARHADDAGLDHLWVLDHIAIPPDDAEGSGGRYVDPLATLAFAAGVTRRVRLGTAVLIVPYRPALPTAKWVASIQELSGGRLVLGVGSGWMAAEFRAAGIPRSERGRITDETLAFLRDCFTNDVVTANGQQFIFSPRPPAPPIMVGGSGARARERVLAYGDGWLPTIGDADELRAPIAELVSRASDAGRPRPAVVPLTQLALDDEVRAAATLAALAEAGCSGVIHAARYDTASEFAELGDRLLRVRETAGLAIPSR